MLETLVILHFKKGTLTAQRAWTLRQLAVSEVPFLTQAMQVHTDLGNTTWPFPSLLEVTLSYGDLKVGRAYNSTEIHRVAEDLHYGYGKLRRLMEEKYGIPKPETC